MDKFMIFGLLATSLCILLPASAEKQIKLEDIEKDNLKAAQQAKLEKQLQQYQQYQSYQQAPVQYEQQVYTQQQSLASYASPYYQYTLPQQYLQQQQQQLYSGYAPLTGNSLGSGYSTSSSVHPYQAYYTPQISSAVQSGQQYAATTQPQSIIMAVASPSYSGIQQQAYYQVLPKTISNLGNVQYVQSQTSPQYYYQPQTHAATGTGLLYSAPQQYIPSYQYITGGKVSPAYQQYLSTAPQTFTTSYSTSGSDYSSAYPAQSAAAAYSTGSVYPQSSAQPTFVSLKAPQHLVASPGQQQQYLQAQAAQTPTTTISPFKYLNSPQYLAQNYNTIQSSHLLPKNSFSSGIKSTVSPPIKFAGNTGFITPSSSSSNSNYHTYRGIAG